MPLFYPNWPVKATERGTIRGYDIASTAFWLVRIFDLGFTIPLGLLSVYLLWTRPATYFPIQFMFYGFFTTMINAVNAMGVIMWLKKNPTFLWRDLAVFLCLGVIVFIGFFYILRIFKKEYDYLLFCSIQYDLPIFVLMFT
jgi:hypothetical protein